MIPAYFCAHLCFPETDSIAGPFLSMHSCKALRNTMWRCLFEISNLNFTSQKSLHSQNLASIKMAGWYNQLVWDTICTSFGHLHLIWISPIIGMIIARAYALAQASAHLFALPVISAIHKKKGICALLMTTIQDALSVRNNTHTQNGY